MTHHDELTPYRSIIEQRKAQPHWTVEPLVEGETIARSYGPNYLRYAETKPPRDFTLIPEMIELLEQKPHQYSAWAIEHLRNAANEALPEDVRTQHYDIAGVHITQHRNDYSHPAFRLWMEGNGA